MEKQVVDRLTIENLVITTSTESLAKGYILNCRLRESETSHRSGENKKADRLPEPYPDLPWQKYRRLRCLLNTLPPIDNCSLVNYTLVLNLQQNKP